MRYITFVLVFALAASGHAEGEEKKAEETVLKYRRPEVSGFAYIAEPFHDKTEFDQHWVLSQAKKDGVDSAISKYDGQWSVEEPSENPIKGDKGLVLKSTAKHHAVSTTLPTKFEFKDQPFIVQYEIKFQNAMECGGAYVKLLSDSADLDLDQFTDKTGYTIMFGPDKCGESSKLHFIFRHKNPVTGKFEEKHAKKPTGEFSKIFDDKKTHLVTLIVKPDGSFEVLVDKTSVNSGNLLVDMDPPVNPPKEIDDPNDKKPEEWDEREKIPDPDAKKPADWDEDAPKQIANPNAKKPEGWLDDAPEYVPDPNAKRPEDWSDEEDGEWEAPQIPNPACADVGCGEWKAPLIENPSYKGKWSAPLINNPAYKGIWKPKLISNPDFFEDKEPFKMTAISALGFELWSMTSDILFDNLIISSDQSVVDQWTADTWELKRTKEFETMSSSEGGLWNQLMEATQERPWLWVLYAAVVFLPFILIAAFCFPSKKDKAAERKKTDEPSPDDEEGKEEDKEEDKKDEDKEGENDDDAAEEKETEEDGTNDKKEEGDKEEEQEKPSQEDNEETKNEDADDTPMDASPRTRAARRRLRKDT